MLQIPLGYASRRTVGLSRRLLGQDRDEVDAELRQQTASQVFRVLSELKGGAMKFGQVLSLFEAALPEDVAEPYREQLRRLQDSAAPMPAARVEAVMAQELGSRWRDLFSSFDRRPSAAASIGQVHRATWAATGQEAAVKIQYPEADQALRSDLTAISRLATVIAPVAGGMDVKALVAEVGERIAEEVDYLREAENQDLADQAFRDDPDFVVPQVLAATPRLLVSTWLEGTPLSEVGSWAEEDRNRVGLSYVRFLFSGPHRAGLLHADPHPGNFLVLPDGRLGVIDWGLVARLPDGLPEPMGRLIRTALAGSAEEMTRGLQAEGLVVADVDADHLLTYLAPFIEPARVSEFHFTRDWMRSQYERLQREASDVESVMPALNVPPVYALIHRVWTGGVAVLCQLDVRARFADVLAELLPGFAADQG